MFGCLVSEWKKDNCKRIFKEWQKEQQSRVKGKNLSRVDDGLPSTRAQNPYDFLQRNQAFLLV
jgi:hypothetical protein